MIYSMTGYGKASITREGFTVTVEMRSLNGKGLDVTVRLPRGLGEFEPEIRQIVRKAVRRGRVEVFVSVEATLPELKAPPINPDLFRLYWYRLQEISSSLPSIASPRFEDVLRIPYIFEQVELKDYLDLFSGSVREVTRGALEMLVSMRAAEGEELRKACCKYLEKIEQAISAIEKIREASLLTLRDRLRDRIMELLRDLPVALDENRLTQEIVFLTERSDIAEEIVRLKSHIGQFRSLLNDPEPAEGRQLDFLVQEMQREATTIGAKASDLDISQAVVVLRTEIAKLKEQVQNIE
ncbi:YicC/YloC family endoribonuclease [Thermodesulforhabdus norvegica]|uniref:TIGR00255 family protein n=1 Tax=Thermodesulforhabdus norvegica TaxID=39841 RepID=A0A1I4SCQ4_9BACT|nr:YicC/YloC family endoribonuclease [Thermodesulforhabdus norvegica]SFM62104.1 TIGR00255 family protein [Thermodesulforhabdus norvegica]